MEARGKEILPLMLAFSFTTTLVLAFTLPGTPLAARRPLFADVISGFLWITVLFSGLIGFARTFEREQEEGAIDALLLVPLDRSALFLAKATTNLIFLAGVEVVLLPVFALLFNLDPTPAWAPLLLVVLLVDLGFVAIGTLFASVASQTRSRELILPVLALPALVPVFIAAVELTSDLLLGNALFVTASRGWFAILVVFDVVAVTIGALAFEFVID